MKITKTQLKKIIKEEIEEVFEEASFKKGDKVTVLNGPAAGARGEIVEVLPGREGFIILLSVSARRKLHGHTGDEIIVSKKSLMEPDPQLNLFFSEQ